MLKSLGVGLVGVLLFGATALPRTGAVVGTVVDSTGAPVADARVTLMPAGGPGVPCVRGLRIPIATIVGMVAEGMTVDEILAAYPDLESEDIREALRFAAEAVRERELPRTGT